MEKFNKHKINICTPVNCGKVNTLYIFTFIMPLFSIKIMVMKKPSNGNNNNVKFTLQWNILHCKLKFLKNTC